MIINIKYWFIVLALNFVPIIIIQKIIGLFWTSDSHTNTNLAIFDLLLTIVIVPFVLLSINYRLAKKHSQTFFIINGLLICCAVTLSAHLGFINWADSVGSRDNPDQETLAVTSFERIAGIVFTVIGTIIGQVNINKRRSF